MKRLDEDKVSLVEFLRSIKYGQRSAGQNSGACPTHFAQFNQRARSGNKSSAEDCQLIRSAN